MSKILFVYYSLEGNTDFAATEAAKYADIDLERLIPDKEPPKNGFGKYFWGGKSAVFKEASVLEPLKHDPDAYDELLIGYPVWASSFPPAINAFLKKYPLSGRKLYVIACSSGGSAQKTFDKLAKAVPDCEIKDTLSLVDPAKDKEKNAPIIKEFIQKNIS